MGRKKFNSFRGKIIAKHSNVIGAFCTTMGADAKKKGLIKLAKDNGGELGFSRKRALAGERVGGARRRPRAHARTHASTHAHRR